MLTTDPKTSFKIKLRELLMAMKLDKTPKTIGQFYDGHGASCALGGAAVILGISPNNLITALAIIKDFDKKIPWIPELNDGTNMSKRDISLQIRQDHPDMLDTIIEYPVPNERKLRPK